jgi:hypothetical protein
MISKVEMIEQLKTEFPTLQLGDDEKGYTLLSPDEYDKTIAEWADVRLAKLVKQAEAEVKDQTKAEILERLGITADEAKLLLA